jgi:hypothetical protein
MRVQDLVGDALSEGRNNPLCDCFSDCFSDSLGHISASTAVGSSLHTLPNVGK